MCTIADAKVRQNYNCYNVYFNECLHICFTLMIQMYIKISNYKPVKIKN